LLRDENRPRGGDTPQPDSPASIFKAAQHRSHPIKTNLSIDVLSELAMNRVNETAQFIPFALPEIGEEEIEEVVNSLRSGWVTTGPKTRQFEADFSDFIGGDVQSIAVNSATAGLHLALEAAGVGPGDEVIVPTYTFTATAEVVRYLGAHPVFVDSDTSSLNMLPEAVDRAISTQTKAIIPVHFAGLAVEMDALQNIARKAGLRVIEDAAHSLPTTYSRKLIGSLDTDATVFSFYATKTITTGEGGMIVTRDAALAERCRTMRLHGISRDAFDRYTTKGAGWRYDVVAPGFKYNLTDLASSIGIHQLRRACAMQMRRAEICAQYDEAFADLPVQLPAHARAGDLHAWHLYVLRLMDEAPVTRDAFIEEMTLRGIGSSVHFIPLHRHPYWRETYALKSEMFPVADDAYCRAVSLPNYSRMSDIDVARVIDAVREILT
jgi:dTDP-4-amino-4,6-dideoxygalactose transaminase